MLLVAGCSPQKNIDADALIGQPLAEVLKTYDLDQRDARMSPNPPPGGPLRTTYFLKSGNLELSTEASREEIVTNAIFLPSDKTAAERSKSWDDGYRKWVEQRTSE